MEQRIGRASPPADERRAGQRAAAGQIDDGARIHRDRAPQQRDATRQLEDVHAADAQGFHRQALVQVAQAVHGTAIGHGQPRGADRCQAARQQPDPPAGVIDPDAHDDAAERRIDIAALLDVGSVQGQGAQDGHCLLYTSRCV